MSQNIKISLIIPAYNEENGISLVIDDVKMNLEKSGLSHEIIVVNDASKDNTLEKIKDKKVVLINNETNMGQGASIKKGIQNASGDYIVLIDGDGTYPADKILNIVNQLDSGFDLVVGARFGKNYWRSFLLTLSRFFFRFIVEIAALRKIPDINSGLRGFKRDKVLSILKDCSNRFSFMTSVTLIFCLNGFKVGYIPIDYFERKGKTKVKYVRDAFRTIKIIFKILKTYKPSRIVFLGSVFFCLLVLAYYVL